MPHMVRKQVYIEQRQDDVLKRVARARGVTEAEVIRQALDRQGRSEPRDFRPDPDAWRSFKRFAERLRARGRTRPRTRDWTRDGLYEERLSRHARRAD